MSSFYSKKMFVPSQDGRPGNTLMRTTLDLQEEMFDFYSDIQLLGHFIELSEVYQKNVAHLTAKIRQREEKIQQYSQQLEQFPVCTTNSRTIQEQLLYQAQTLQTSKKLLTYFKALQEQVVSFEKNQRDVLLTKLVTLQKLAKKLYSHWNVDAEILRNSRNNSFHELKEKIHEFLQYPILDIMSLLNKNVSKLKMQSTFNKKYIKTTTDSFRTIIGCIEEIKKNYATRSRLTRHSFLHSTRTPSLQSIPEDPVDEPNDRAASSVVPCCLVTS